jgi:hypothetical protein
MDEGKPMKLSEYIKRYGNKVPKKRQERYAAHIESLLNKKERRTEDDNKFIADYNRNKEFIQDITGAPEPENVAEYERGQQLEESHEESQYLSEPDSELETDELKQQLVDRNDTTMTLGEGSQSQGVTKTIGYKRLSLIQRDGELNQPVLHEYSSLVKDLTAKAIRTVTIACRFGLTTTGGSTRDVVSISY